MSPESGPLDAAPLAAETFERLEIKPDPLEVIRYLGYPAGERPYPKVLERIEKTIAGSWGLLEPRGAYAVYGVLSQGRRFLRLSSGAVLSGAIGEYLGPVRRAAVFLATAGPAIVEAAEKAMAAGDRLGGLILGAIGSEGAEAAVEALARRLKKQVHPGEALTLRYSPGYCGLSLSQQRVIFQHVEAGKIGVELLPTLIMKPVKSVSGIIGIGAASAVKAGSPCDRCPLLDCRMRR